MLRQDQVVLRQHLVRGDGAGQGQAAAYGLAAGAQAQHRDVRRWVDQARRVSKQIRKRLRGVGWVKLVLQASRFLFACRVRTVVLFEHFMLKFNSVQRIIFAVNFAQ